MNNLSITNLTVKYMYGAVAIDNLSIDIKANQTLVMLGEEESGKTSMLLSIAGLMPCQKGEISFDGKNITNIKPKDRDVLMLFQDGGFFARKTLYYNLAYSLKIREIDDQEIKRKVYQVANEYNLVNQLNYRMSSLSGNDKVRFLVARATIRDAKIILFDDIFKLADDREKMFIELYPSIKNIKSIKIFATTSIDESRTFDTDIMLLNMGKNMQIGSYSYICNTPVCLTAYKFVNSFGTNYVETSLCRDKTGLYVNLVGTRVKIDDKLSLIDDIYIDKDIIVAFNTVASASNIKVVFDYDIFVKNIRYRKSHFKDETLMTPICYGEESFFDIDVTNVKLFDIASELSIFV